MKKQKILAATLCLGLALFGLSACGKGKSEDAIKVNDDVLKTDYIDTFVDFSAQQNGLEEGTSSATLNKAQTIDGLINKQLLLQEADRRGISITDEEREKTKENVYQAYGSEEAYKDYLKQYGIDDKTADEDLDANIKLQKLSDELKAENETLDQDARAFYEENRDNFNVEETVKASHILVEDEATAKDIIKQLEEGKDFSELAKKFSLDEGNKDAGGDLGYFTKEQMVESFSEAAFSMEPGTFSKEPVKTEFGYHVIKVEDKKAPHTQTYEEVEDKIKNMMADEYVNQRLTDLIAKLKDEANIEYLLDGYNPETLNEQAVEEMKAEAKSDAESAPKEDAQTETENADSESK